MLRQWYQLKNIKVGHKTLYVQEAQKGLKNFHINLEIKTLIKNKLNLVFKKPNRSNVTFNRNQIRKIKFDFKRFDKNNYWLSNLLYLQSVGLLFFENKHFQKLVTISKLLGLWRSSEFEAIKELIITFLNELKYGGSLKKNKCFSNEHDEIISNQIKNHNLVFKNNLDYAANVFQMILENTKTLKFNYDQKFTTFLAELNYLEDQKTRYFIQNQKDTIFGSIKMKSITKYKNTKINLEKKFGGNLVRQKDDKVMDQLINTQESILSLVNKKIEQIIHWFSINNLQQHEYNFIFEQTGKPYFKDHMPLSNNDKILLIVNYLMLMAWSFIVAIPIYYVAYNAFNEYSTTILSLKGFKFSFANFDYLFKETMFTKWFLNTIKIALVVTFVNLLSSSLLAYALSRFRFKGRKPAFKMLIILNMLPSIAGLTSYIVLNQLLQNLFDAGPYLVMYLVYAGTNLLAFSFVIKNYLDTISREIDEAAKMDGASSLRTFIKIIIPLIAPILGIVALQSFMIPFIDILMPKFFLSKSEDYTLPLGLTFIKNNPDLSIQNQGAYTAGGMLVAIPMTIVYFTADYFMKQNKAQGAIKG